MSLLPCFRRLSWSQIAAAVVISGLLISYSAKTQAAAPDADKDSAAKAADDENPNVWKPRIRSVAVFKNGLGFFQREGETGLRDGWCVAAQVPPAAFGTLAIYSRSENETVDVVGSGPGDVVEFDGRDVAKDAETKRARLEAAKRLKVQLTYKQKGADRTAAGKLASVGPEYVVLDNESQDFAVPLAGITKMQVLDLPLRIHTTSKDSKAPQKATLGMAYLRQGITWIPDYTLKVLDDENAELTLRGTLVNEAEDLIHTDVNLVVGVPHFVHTGSLAPLAVGQVIRSIGSAIGGMPAGVNGQMMSNSIVVQNFNNDGQHQFGVVERPAEDGSGDLNRALGNLPQLDAAAATDYTVYSKNDLTLRRGEKAILTLFVKKIKYAHIYRWTPPTGMEHSLVLKNQTDSAWTTGPCLALSGDQPLSEDMLKYTPKGGHGELPVTTSINVVHDKTEREVDRKLKTYEPAQNVNYDLVTLEGTLKLKNFEKRPVDVEIVNNVSGKPLDADNKGKVAVDSTKLRLLEREGSVHWKITLAPGEEKTLTYKYERYVPSN